MNKTVVTPMSRIISILVFGYASLALFSSRIKPSKYLHSLSKLIRLVGAVLTGRLQITRVTLSESVYAANQFSPIAVKACQINGSSPRMCSPGLCPRKTRYTRCHNRKLHQVVICGVDRINGIDAVCARKSMKSRRSRVAASWSAPDIISIFNSLGFLSLL